MGGDGRIGLKLPGGGLYSAIVHIRDEKTSGTQSGGFTAGSWQTRDLNTIMEDSGSNASLATNQITLQAGIWDFDSAALGFDVDFHKLRLQNISDASTIEVGLNSYCPSGINTQSTAECRGSFTINTTKILELQHRCLTTRTANGFGAAISFGVAEVYAEIILKKRS